MPAGLCMANSHLVVAYDLKWMANNTIYVVIARLEKAINRRWIVIISNKRFGFLVWATNDFLLVVSSSIGWPIMTYI